MSPTPIYYIAPLTRGSCFYLYKFIPVLNLIKDHSDVRPHLQKKYLSKIITVWHLDNRFRVVSADQLFYSDFDIKENIFSVRITEEEFDYLSTKFEDGAGDLEEFYKIIENYGRLLVN